MTVRVSRHHCGQTLYLSRRPTPSVTPLKSPRLQADTVRTARVCKRSFPSGGSRLVQRADYRAPLEPQFNLNLPQLDLFKTSILPHFNPCSAGNLEPRFGNHGLQTLGNWLPRMRSRAQQYCKRGSKGQKRFCGYRDGVGPYSPLKHKFPGIFQSNWSHMALEVSSLKLLKPLCFQTSFFKYAETRRCRGALEVRRNTSSIHFHCQRCPGRPITLVPETSLPRIKDSSVYWSEPWRRGEKIGAAQNMSKSVSDTFWWVLAVFALRENCREVSSFADFTGKFSALKEFCQGSVHGGFQTVVRVLSRELISLPPLTSFNPFLSQVYLILTSFLPLNINLTSFC